MPNLTQLAEQFKEPRKLRALFILWLLLAVAGLIWVNRFATTPGTAAPTRKVWPTESKIQRSVISPTLVVFLHPKCSCSLNTLTQLEPIVAQYGKRLKTLFVVYAPAAMPEAWTRDKLWRQAENLTSATLIPDRDGVEARRFQASTSGQTYLFDRNGELLFSGGVTPDRSHLGDSLGTQIISAVLNNQTSNRQIAPVFGCDLFTRRK